uniref:Reverse transcriptase Ty1/copia-type domain-containing protein n=1 Tax=Cannabis sativa TaxID=3483 RepID=A0A803PBI7_CANSA
MSTPHAWFNLPAIKNFAPFSSPTAAHASPSRPSSSAPATPTSSGFHQRPDLDFGETFSPVVKAVTVRVVLTLAVAYDWEVRQVDINNTFLNGTLDEDVYMIQPPGFEDPQKPHHVCKLHKSIYGLKQAPRALYDQLKTTLIQWGFENSKADSSFFMMKHPKHVILVLVYVDDIVKAKLENTKPSVTPMTAGKPLSISNGTPLSQPTIFRIVIGALQYLSHTRPDISFAVNKLSQFIKQPTDVHWGATKRILRYLKGTMHHGLHIAPSVNLTLVGFSNADWACCPNDRKSVAGYCVYLGDSLISWSSKKQTVVARSSTESEYRALAHLAAELSWLQELLNELNFKCSSVPVIWCDNLSASALASNPIYHARTKHIEMDLHFVSDKVLDKKLEIRYVPSHDQIVDCLTKGLTPTR